MSESHPVIVIQEGPRANRYREVAESLFESYGTLEYVDCGNGVPLAERERQLDDLLPAASAVLSTPWLGGTAPGLELPAFDKPRWDRSGKLRVIAGTYDFRLDWIDPAEADKRGVALVDTSRTMTPTVAEFGVAMTLNLLRCIPRELAIVRDGGWATTPPDGDGYVYGDLSGRRIGLAGYGSINRHYRRFIKAFGCKVHSFDPYVSDDAMAIDGVETECSLVSLAARSEIFVVAIPPTPTTLGVIDRSVIDALPNGSLFVLLSRMAVIDQDALWRRVQAEELRVAIDVFDPEPPPPDAWFRHHPNVLPTPHIAGSAMHAHKRCFSEACADTLTVLQGGQARHLASATDKMLYDGSLEAVPDRSHDAEGRG